MSVSQPDAARHFNLSRWALDHVALTRYFMVVLLIAGFVAYLAGPEASFITGASLTIDGGFSA